ncbi:MAG: GGDEF domain-containing protein [Pseudomonadota bacterium]
MAAQDIKQLYVQENADPLLISFLDVVVLLTCQRDEQGLSTSLIDSLCQHVQADRFRLLAISNATRDTGFSERNVGSAVVRDWLDPAAAPIPIAEDPDLAACVRTQNQVSRLQLGANTRRLVLPIFGATYVTALLVIEGLRKLSGEDEVLSRLLRIFSNQAYLLSRSEMDGLTGLYNRQSFDARIKHQVLEAGQPNRRRRLQGETTQNCLVILDIDHFKEVNDRYGHLYGDEVLVQVARLMSCSFRAEDLLFRYGGEEFAVVLSGIAPEEAVRVLEVFRQTIESYAFPQIGHKTVSIGVAGISSGESVDTIINRADKAMYYAKQHGRNRVCCYETLVAEGTLASVTVATGDIELF